MKQTTFYTELAYIFGVVGLALGTAFMEKAEFGVSMVVAPAYLVYLKLSQTWSFVTFGMAEYLLQACLLVIMVLFLKKFKISYLFSFVTAVFYGLTLDRWMTLFTHIGTLSFVWRIVFYVTGLLLCATGVAFIFHTYIAPEVYELFVKEVSAEKHRNINHVKTGYDCTSCLIGIILSFLFFGFLHFEGVRWGTAVCALINGKIIGIISRRLEHHLNFVDGLPMRKYFE
jgi:uncharacterized protein